MLNIKTSYYRKDCIVFETETAKPVLKLKQWFPDKETLTTEAVKYLNKYCGMFPELCEEFKPNTNEQLSLF